MSMNVCSPCKGRVMHHFEEELAAGVYAGFVVCLTKVRSEEVLELVSVLWKLAVSAGARVALLFPRSAKSFITMQMMCRGYGARYTTVLYPSQYYPNINTSQERGSQNYTNIPYNYHHLSNQSTHNHSAIKHHHHSHQLTNIDHNHHLHHPQYVAILAQGLESRFLVTNWPVVGSLDLDSAVFGSTVKPVEAGAAYPWWVGRLLE